MSQQFFDKIYRTTPDYYGTEVRPEFHRYLDLLGPEGCRIVDLGCGQGRHALAAAGRGARVHAVDQSPVALKQLAGAAAAAGLDVTTALADLSAIGRLDGVYDGAILVTSLDHLTGPQILAMEEALRAGLAPGGMVYIETFTVRDPGFLRDAPASETRLPVRHYFAEGELAQTFERWETVESKEFTERDDGHGAPHMHGMALLIARNLRSE